MRQSPRPVLLQPSYLYSIVSITLVLFLLGLLGLVVLHAQTISKYFKENIEIAVIFKDDAKEADIFQVQKLLEGESYVKSAAYISKEEALEKLKQEFGGEDPMELLEQNPLYNSIALYVKEDYANPDSLNKMEEGLMLQPAVKEIYYPRAELEMLNRNVNRVGLALLAVSVLLLVIVIALIDNTIRLAMYSKRFLIKSMQLVGATRWFIIRPFLGRSVANGLLGGLAAILLLTAALYYAQQQVPEMIFLQDPSRFALLFAAVTLLGVLISWLSTWRAVSKYLRMKLDSLY